MKSKIITEVTIEAELTHNDLIKIVQDNELVHKDRVFYSIEVIGNGVSKGATLKIKYSSSEEK